MKRFALIAMFFALSAILTPARLMGQVIFESSFEESEWRGTSPLNDTGIDWGGNYPEGNNTTCTGETIAAQDCSHGRDATDNDDSDGHAGFSFTKLDANGDALPAAASEWVCVRDEVTGLTWEVKTDDGGLRDADNTYNWFEIDTYVQAVNAQTLCGDHDWRMPWREELRSIVDYGRDNPAIDTSYFPYSGWYWSDSPLADPTYFGKKRWAIGFNDGEEGPAFLDEPLRVRLVRREG